jgi:hypothetical protein
VKVGFTGTREGCTPAQGGALARWFRDNAVTVFRHGACLGADTEAVIHCAHYRPDAVVIAHRSDLAAMTSEIALQHSHGSRDPKPPLERNRDIVDACDLLIVCPKGTAEEQRSGTWATVRYARKRMRHQVLRIVFVWPDGTVTEE